MMRISESEYLEFERQAPHKSEYYQGEIFAMAGASINHNKIVASIIMAVGQHLKGKGVLIFPAIYGCITQPIHYILILML
jgi:Uma2 family endonuclease